MPPKRKGSGRGSATATGKRVRIGGTSIIPQSPATLSGRPRRESAGNPNYALVVPRSRNGSLAKLLPVTSTAATVGPRPRGRPPGIKKVAPASELTDTATSAKPGRGRPRKPSTVATSAPPSTKRKRAEGNEEAAAEQPPRKRGRPAHSATATTASAKAKVKKQEDETASKKRSTKSIPISTKAPAAQPAKKRGRPVGYSPATANKAATTKATTTKKATKATQKTALVAKHKTNKTATSKKNADEKNEATIMALVEEHENNEGTQYWLMKAEPDSRTVKDVDVSFPIDKLAAATVPEPWDGVRNAVARNNMRAMRKGDLAFFYHSSCDVPGIVGAMRIVEEHSVDESAFDPNHPYFDHKSKRDKPTWDCVKVEFVKKFENPVTLKALKADPKLVNMQIAQKAYGRLSVQAVTPAQWKYVLKMADEPEDMGVISATSGYEADTNGETETDKEAVEDSVGIDDIDAAKMAAYGNLDDPATNDDHDAATAHNEADLHPKVEGTIDTIVNGAASILTGRNNDNDAEETDSDP